MTHHFSRWYFNNSKSSEAWEVAGIYIPMEEIFGVSKGLSLCFSDSTKSADFSKTKKPTINKQGIDHHISPCWTPSSSCCPL